jgi:hypothetical protein
MKAKDFKNLAKPVSPAKKAAQAAERAAKALYEEQLTRMCWRKWGYASEARATLVAGRRNQHHTAGGAARLQVPGVPVLAYHEQAASLTVDSNAFMTTMLPASPFTSPSRLLPGLDSFIGQAEALLRSAVAGERFAQLQERVRGVLTDEGFQVGGVRSCGVIVTEDGRVELQGEMTVVDSVWMSSFVVVHKLLLRHMPITGPQMYVSVGVANYEGPGTLTLSTAFLVSEIQPVHPERWAYHRERLAQMGEQPFHDEEESLAWFVSELNDVMTP